LSVPVAPRGSSGNSPSQTHRYEQDNERNEECRPKPPIASLAGLNGNLVLDAGDSRRRPGDALGLDSGFGSGGQGHGRRSLDRRV
jgi:hypothetical protein